MYMEVICLVYYLINPFTPTDLYGRFQINAFYILRVGMVKVASLWSLLNMWSELYISFH